MRRPHTGYPDGVLKFSGKASGETTATKVASDLVTGRVTLVAGVATVTTSKATATANIFTARQVAGGTPGVSIIITRTAGTSFTLTSKAADGTTTATSDTSTIGYLLIEP
jgi:hypothetical protein